MRILCSGYFVRHPLGGRSWAHLQYLVGLQRLGHEVFFLEEHGWPGSCFDPLRDVMTDDPTYGMEFLDSLLRPYGLEDSWCYLAADGTSFGMGREELVEVCRSCDLYMSISNINWTPELEACRRRILVDTDPVFTQVGSQGRGPPFSWYDARFTYGENVHTEGCGMPPAGVRWLPTRQPVVLDLWPVVPGPPDGPFTTVMNWTPIDDERHRAPQFGQKDRSFEPFVSFPLRSGVPMEVAVDPPAGVAARLLEGGWLLADPVEITLSPEAYQGYIRRSRAEFSVAKHGYVITGCGWFSERSTSYLASGRPVIVEDTGFSRWLPTGKGVLAFRDVEDALACVEEVNARYELHCRWAREIVESHFEAGSVLSSLLERAFGPERAVLEHAAPAEP